MDVDAKAMLELEMQQKLQEAEWNHTQAMADLQKNLAEAEVN